MLQPGSLDYTVCWCRRFLAGSDSDSEEEDKRVVRSAKDKRFEELSKSCDEMRVRLLLLLPARCATR